MIHLTTRRRALLGTGALLAAPAGARMAVA
jgi:hypothetical protein